MSTGTSSGINENIYVGQPTSVPRQEILNSSGAIRTSKLDIQTAYQAIATATLAQINAAAPGTTILAGFTGTGGLLSRQIIVTKLEIVFTGAFTTATSIDIQSTNATPVIVMSVPIASATNGAIVTDSTAGVTRGAGFRVALGTGDGLAIRRAGSNAAGGTSVSILIEYILNHV